MLAYNQVPEAPYGDATKEVMLRHNEQLRPFFENNHDIIDVLQAGMIGTWGELVGLSSLISLSLVGYTSIELCTIQHLCVYCNISTTTLHYQSVIIDHSIK